MAGIQASGAGSGIDINSLVSQLVAAERAPQERRLGRAQAGVDSQISALGSLRGALSSLQSSLSSIRTESAFRARKVDVSDTAAITATATSAAATGSYEVEVLQLASSQRLASGAFAGGSTATIGTGTLTVTVGGNAFSVAIDAARNSVAGIRDAINSAPDNTGVQATVIQAVDGARLVLSSTRPGVGGAMRVTQSGGDGGLAALVYDPGVATSLAQLAAAQDASVRIEGFTVSSPTNGLSSAVDGVTLNLLKAAPGTTLRVTVEPDAAQSTDRIRKFVTDYNAAIGTIATLRRFDPATRAAGPLLGDSLLQGIETRLRAELSRPTTGVADGYASLAAIGIRTAADGKLTIDETRLAAALTADYDAVGRMFGSTGGLASRLYGAIDAPLQSGGSLTTRTTDLQESKRGIEREREALDRRMQSVEKRYRAQFVAMDNLLSQLQSTGNYLTQQLAALPKPRQD
jgi:flagellar hook-associated protein 2